MGVSHGLWVMLVGAIVVLAPLAQSAAARLRIAGPVALIALGLLLGLLDRWLDVITPAVRDAVALLADIGVVALLFRVGLESKLSALLSALPRATLVWAGDVGLSTTLAFVGAHYCLGYALVPSLVVAVALSATSIGVCVATWEEAKRIDTPVGRLTLDVAELDDISGVVLLTLFVASLPLLQGGAADATIASAVATSAVPLVAKVVAFGIFCLLFSRHVEPRISRVAARLKPPPARMLVVAGVGFMIAALADALGFSLAVGALFAGLVFSRDPVAVKVEARFDDLYAFFTPFFFVGIGLSVQQETIASTLLPGLALLAAAVIGKLLGGGLPALAFTGMTGALAVGLSLIPRAEIALYVAREAQAAGDDVLSPEGYATLVFVALATSLLGPLLLRPLLRNRSLNEKAQ